VFTRCPVSLTLQVIGGKRKPLVTNHLNEGHQRNGKPQRAIPKITQKILTQQLIQRRYHDPVLGWMIQRSLI